MMQTTFAGKMAEAEQNAGQLGFVLLRKKKVELVLKHKNTYIYREGGGRGGGCWRTKF